MAEILNANPMLQAQWSSAMEQLRLSWSASDGGMLRVFDSAGGERVREDLPPESGSLVLFDSKRVSHEVLPTRRQRACLVGWFRA